MRGALRVRDPEPNIGMLLSLAFRAFVVQLHERLAAAGYPDIRPSHTHVFQWIGGEGSRVADMAERAQLTKQAMAQLVEDLEARGYVERLPDPSDRRAKIVRLTDAGWAVVRVGNPAIQEIESSWTQVMGEQATSVLRGALQQLVTAHGRRHPHLPE